MGQGAGQRASIGSTPGTLRGERASENQPYPHSAVLPNSNNFFLLNSWLTVG